MLEPTPQQTEALVDSFAALNVSQTLLQTLERIGYQRPTPVQAAAIPLIYAGIDLIVQSQTGTGKTAAFAIPICDMLRESPAASGQAVVECLVLVPTRELAKQVCAEFARLAPDLPSTAIYGGTSYGPQLEAIKTARVIAATPGRFLDHLRSGNLKLDNLRLFVLDEADEMLSMGFQEELDAIIEFLPAGGCQSLLFSATVSEDIRSLASHFLQHPEFVSLSSDSVAAKSVKHLYYVTTGLSQLRDLVTLIEAHDPDSALIFCNTKDDTQLVASHLQRTGYKADVINGDLPQSERERALYTLKDGQIRFLVATDVAARGIDISGLPFVINYQMPISAENYIHRTGRTGRAGKKGVAITLMTPREIGTYYQLIRVFHIDLEERPLPTREQLNEIREARVREQLVERLRQDPNTRRHTTFLTLAERLRSVADGQELVARLVASYETSQRREDARTTALERAREQLLRQQDETRELRERATQAEQHVQALRERIADLERTVEESASLRERLEAASREAAASAAELAAATEATRLAEARLAEVTRSAADNSQRADRAEQRLVQLERERDQAQRALETTRTELEEARRQLDTLRRQAQSRPAPTERAERDAPREQRAPRAVAPEATTATRAAAPEPTPAVEAPRPPRRRSHAARQAEAAALPPPIASVADDTSFAASTENAAPFIPAVASADSRLEEGAERYSSRGARRERRRTRRERSAAPVADTALTAADDAFPRLAEVALDEPTRTETRPRPAARDGRRDEREPAPTAPPAREQEAQVASADAPGESQEERTGGRRRRSRRRGRSEHTAPETNAATVSSPAPATRETPAAAEPPVAAPVDDVLAADADESGFATIAVQVERPEIIDHPDKLRELVCYMAGLFPEDLGDVSRANGRFFVDVRADYAHDVVEALDGQAWKGRRMRARAAAPRT